MVAVRLRELQDTDELVRVHWSKPISDALPSDELTGARSEASSLFFPQRELSKALRAL